MTLFIALALALTVLALWPLMSALRRPSATPERQRASPTNLALLREQRTQLDAELAAGLLSPDEHTQAQTELARRVLQESASAERSAAASPRSAASVALLLVVPALAVGLYAWLGEPDAVRYEAELAKAQGEVSNEELDAMVRQMTQQLESKPPGQAVDAPAWEMLARAHASRQRFADADKAYQRALELTPDNPNLLADRADLLSLLQGQSAAGEAMRLVNRALEIDPGHPKALALAGSSAYSRKDFVSAEAFWQRARERAAPGSPFAQGLESSLEAARAGIASQPDGAARLAAAPADPPRAATNHPGVRGQITIAPELQAKLAPGDTLFVFARPVQGPRMPLAVMRVAATAGPLPFALDDSQAMAPELRISMHEQVVVEARISRTGQAMPQSGDLQGSSGPVASNSAQLQIKIDSVVP
ncbi:c-type cytochrome biogenesis protein CcmI [Hydrogenophaga sp.]|uniref:c-type cytochrome biogenesis protein CcmI n=1 Tax=Hydrogenophaga sp. TaxID=1904254 RepID=UPI002ABA9977|nr:c-type cytochrome biogenesis protein CcmI [Hydrogenophaga sp.]MDZ4396886.1 c-type cytochrome biogenesis protein CcmI [Hydrogenophaga sp.]